MKNKLILLVSMLLPLVSGCGDKPTTVPTNEQTSEIVFNYKESDFTEILNNIHYFLGYKELPVECDYNLAQLVTYNPIIMELSEVKNYYTCAYIHNDDLKIIEESSSCGRFLENSPLFSGINALHFRKYETRIYSKETTMQDTIWYEIPKSEEIPKTIGDYTLSMITNETVYSVYDLDGNLLKNQTVFFENYFHEIYDEIYKDKKRLGIIRRIHNDFFGKNEEYINNLIVRDINTIHGSELYEYSLYQGQLIELINQTKYISVYNPKLIIHKNEFDLSSIYEFVEEKTSIYPYKKYYFKLSDIISFIKEINT